MSGAEAKLWPLTKEQRPAVDPADTVWLSASAGTGKTQVLSARVLRLLLQADVSPSQVLCLTFTKAGATEMAARINEVLARWVRARPEALAADLKAIGADYGPQAQARARTLFAEVLDCPGGGLRIDTIHAFAQWLLSAFPHEAGLTPGTRALEDRDRDLLLQEVLAALLVEAERDNDRAALTALEQLSVRLGPDAVERYLLRCAQAREVWIGPAAWQPPMLPRLFRLLGLPGDAGPGDLAAMCSDDAFPVEALRCCLSAYSQWNGKKGQEGRVVIADWLAASAAQRTERLDDLHKVLFTQKDTVRDVGSLEKFEESFGLAAEAVLAQMLALRERRAMLELAEWLAPALELGRKFALAWDEAKARAGFIDFDDQIRAAADLLGRSELSEWIRYKLDRRFDHILVDEAQDTNAAQWSIINALTGDFFGGESARSDRLRTLFVVGDYKQAIFRFQGTSPENFEAAKQRVRKELDGLSAAPGSTARGLQDLGLGTSFRTAQPVLQFVDMAIAGIGHQSFGLPNPPDAHAGEERPGLVALWRVIGGETDADNDGSESDDGAGEEDSWFARSDRQLAERIAQQIRQWMDHGFPLVKGRSAGEPPRAATPGDVMVLVRKRKELAGLIVARLHAAGVAVAGVDRLRLAAPLAVRDLMAALRFAVQPLDDLNLACLLVSPLIGWSQEQLLEHGYRPDRVRLWDHLRAARAPETARVVSQLIDLLGQADRDSPLALLHWLLIGPWQGRKRLIARLGREAGDPIDELLNAASAFAAGETLSLAGFIHWFDAGEGELKREAGQRRDEVRVMTVHGSKGLQAPIVILADAAANPDGSRGGAIDLSEAPPAEDNAPVPLPPLRQEERLGRIAEAEAKVKLEERQEHWRLLYVAMTRAEEALFVGGVLGRREKEPAPDSWYARLAALFQAEEWIEDPIWGARLEHGELAAGPAVRADAPAPDQLALLPPWLDRPAPAEPRPPRPLAPSALGDDQSADPPFPPGAGQAAARRGILLHRLLERLPEVPEADRKAAASAWLAKAASDLDRAGREEIAAAALKVVAHPEWADLFSPAALAEVPIAATVGDQVVAGTIDRLLLLPDRIRLIDFKTARRPPASLDDVPVAILRQMAAYAAALEASYPGRRIEAALLYTQTPQLLEIPSELLALHKQSLLAAQQN